MSVSPRLREIEPRLIAVERMGSSVTERAFFLSQKRVSDLTPNEIAFCLRQNFARVHILPLALELLDKNPLIEVEFYEGDLLIAALDAAKDQTLTDEQLNVLKCKFRSPSGN